MRLVVRLNREQAHHVRRLADAANCSEVEIVVGFVEMDRRGENAAVPEEVVGLVNKLAAALGIGKFSSPAKQVALAALQADMQENKGGRGKRAFTPAQEERIAELRKKLGWNAKSIAEDMVGNGVQCSRGSVLRALRRAGL